MPLLGGELVRCELVPEILDWMASRRVLGLLHQLGLVKGSGVRSVEGSDVGQLGKTTDIVSMLLSTATASGLALLAWLAAAALIRW